MAGRISKLTYKGGKHLRYFVENKYRRWNTYATFGLDVQLETLEIR